MSWHYLRGSEKIFPSIDRVRWLLIEFSISVFNEEVAKAECIIRDRKLVGGGCRFQNLKLGKLYTGHYIIFNLNRNRPCKRSYNTKEFDLIGMNAINIISFFINFINPSGFWFKYFCAKYKLFYVYLNGHHMENVEKYSHTVEAEWEY